jgi:hypothetical protein
MADCAQYTGFAESTRLVQAAWLIFPYPTGICGCYNPPGSFTL